MYCCKTIIIQSTLAISNTYNLNLFLIKNFSCQSLTFYILQMVKNFNQISFWIICTFCFYKTEIQALNSVEQARRFCNVTDTLPLWHPCVVVYWNTAHYYRFKVSARTPPPSITTNRSAPNQPTALFRPWVVYLNQQRIVTPFKANGCQRLSTVCVRVVSQCFCEPGVYLNYCTEFLHYIIFKGQNL